MAARNTDRIARVLCGTALLGLLLWLSAKGWAAGERTQAPPDPGQAAMADRLARPVLGELPTQVEIGRYQYYYNCMPCHGDRGQGLTDEWRNVWVEDHRNCWARGCHTGKSELAAFYIPRVVPPVAGLNHFPTAQALFTFLRATQPPQRPGSLTDAEYWAVTAFLLYQSGRLSPDEEIGPSSTSFAVPRERAIGALLAIVLALLAGVGLGRKRYDIMR